MATISVEVRQTIRRPVDLVSRQFSDIQHHARHRVHRDVKFTVLAEEGDTCRFTQETRLVGIIQKDEVLQRREPNGCLDAEVVDGANKGMRIHLAFTPVGTEATLVTFRAELTASGIKRVLKPLFEMAVRRAVAKGLEEDRIDLEERGYGTTHAGAG